MSWKGLQKAVARLPHTFLTKAGFNSETIDPEFQDLESRFQSLETNASKLHTDAKKFKDSLAMMLQHQESFAVTLKEVYEPLGSGSRRGSETDMDANPEVPVGSRNSLSQRSLPRPTPPASMQAVEHFALIAAHARESLLPDLEVIERRLVSPTADLVSLLANVKKHISKRGHKLIDFDRHRESVRKLKEKADRTVSDEKALGKAEAALDQASREYNHYNTLLKQQLPVLLSLKVSFVDPCFQTLYWYQLRVHRTLLESYQVLVDNAAPTVVNKSTSATAGFEGKAEMQMGLLEDLTLLSKNRLKNLHEGHASSSGQDDQGYYTASSTENSPETAEPPHAGGYHPYNEAPIAPAAPPAYSSDRSYKPPTTAKSTYQPPAANDYNEAPPSSSSTFRSMHESSAPKGFQLPAFETENAWASTSSKPSTSSVYGKPAPPPLASKPSNLTKKVYVVALYDYDAQAPGDLSFKRDDKIEIVQKTGSGNDWWTGRLNGNTGISKMVAALFGPWEGNAMSIPLIEFVPNLSDPPRLSRTTCTPNISTPHHHSPIKMAGGTLGHAAKAPGIMRNQILVPADFMEHMGKNGDAKYVDLSKDHRAYMREKLYGAGRDNKILRTLFYLFRVFACLCETDDDVLGCAAYSYLEVGAHKANYADEAPPPWSSTSKEAYTRKDVKANDAGQRSKELSTYIKASHFSLEGHGSEAAKISTTKRDYNGKSAEHRDPIIAKSTYPPIFRDESQKGGERSEYDSKYPKRVNPPARIVHPDSMATHFSLGDDPGSWTTVTASTFVDLHPPPADEVNRPDKRKSTVLDNPDGEKPDLISFQKSDYIMPADLDRSKLIVDNTLTVKDLKSTHFSLGNDTASNGKSQYQSSFKGNNSGVELVVPQRHGNHNESGGKNLFSHMQFETEPVPMQSTHKHDYADKKKTAEISSERKAYARELKTYQKKTSISFGSDESGLSNGTRSITRADFGVPSDRKEAADALLPDANLIYLQPKFTLGFPKPGKRSIRPAGLLNPYSPIATYNDDSSEKPAPKGSVMKADYVSYAKSHTDANGKSDANAHSGELNKVFKDTQEHCHSTKHFLRGHHFSLGSDAIQRQTSMRAHYAPPSKEAIAAYKVAPYGKDITFQKTLENTISRYPLDPSTFTTVTSLSYPHHTNPVRPEGVKPPSHTVFNHSTPANTREMSETRRAYIPPEVMKYGKGMDDPRRDGLYQDLVAAMNRASVDVSA
ncbi:hypothetical protein HDV05_004034 [Chytridiales sp. JEL 0842]|nr:hypothetical protein HDV05_004034 [Chytridiales sp. JEL 0842]